MRKFFGKTREKGFDCDDLCPACKRKCVLENGHIVPDEESPRAHHCEHHWWMRIRIVNESVLVQGLYSNAVTLKTREKQHDR